MQLGEGFEIPHRSIDGGLYVKVTKPKKRETIINDADKICNALKHETGMTFSYIPDVENGKFIGLLFYRTDDLDDHESASSIQPSGEVG